ncbi:MAG: DUF2059 domain-containing protein [Paracoccaceae bacterium]
MRAPIRKILTIFAFAIMAMGLGRGADAAADRDKVDAFLEITGFDVAIESLTLAAGDAPAMLGMEASDFGADWSRVAGQVFDVAVMHDMAASILEQALEPDLLDHAAGFYASDLGRRLVQVENESHMRSDKDVRRVDGSELVADMLRDSDPRLEILKRMNKAVDAGGASVRAIEEIQVRFLMAAAAADVIRLKVDEGALRARMAEGRDAMRRQMMASSLASSAEVYAGFTNDELEEYTSALEDERMQTVYELMNAVQYEIMANRYERLAVKMADLHPGQEL